MFSLEKLTQAHFQGALQMETLFVSRKELGFDPEGGNFVKKQLKDNTIKVVKQNYEQFESGKFGPLFKKQNDYMYLVDPSKEKYDENEMIRRKPRPSISASLGMFNIGKSSVSKRKSRKSSLMSIEQSSSSSSQS